MREERGGGRREERGGWGEEGGWRREERGEGREEGGERRGEGGERREEEGEEGTRTEGREHNKVCLVMDRVLCPTHLEVFVHDL